MNRYDSFIVEDSDNLIELPDGSIAEVSPLSNKRLRNIRRKYGEYHGYITCNHCGLPLECDPDKSFPPRTYTVYDYHEEHEFTSKCHPYCLNNVSFRIY